MRGRSLGLDSKARPGPNFRLVVNKLDKVIVVFKSEKLGLKTGSRVLITGSSLSGIDSLKPWLRLSLGLSQA